MKKYLLNSFLAVALISASSLAFSGKKPEATEKTQKSESTKTETTGKDQAVNKEANMSNEVTTESGLKYVDIQKGDGDSPKAGQQVTVHYVGTLENGDKFDSSVDRGTPFQFTIGVGQVIKGWDEGVATMRVGGKRKLIIPAELGYGSADVGAIPPNSTLIFEVELLEVQS